MVPVVSWSATRTISSLMVLWWISIILTLSLKRANECYLGSAPGPIGSSVWMVIVPSGATSIVSVWYLYGLHDRLDFLHGDTPGTGVVY